MSPIEVGKIIPLRQSVNGAPPHQVSPGHLLCQPLLWDLPSEEKNFQVLEKSRPQSMYYQEIFSYFG